MRQSWNSRSSRGVASDSDFSVDVPVRPLVTPRAFEHVPCQIVRHRLHMPPGLDIPGKQVKKRGDGRIFMLGGGAADDNLSIVLEVECDLGADIDLQCPADSLGQRDLALRGHCRDFVDDRHDLHSFCALRIRKDFSLQCHRDVGILFEDSPK